MLLSYLSSFYFGAFVIFLVELVFGKNVLIQRLHRGEFVQEGIGRLWRGTNASLALAVPTVSL